jgi:hypothetical protein
VRLWDGRKKTGAEYAEKMGQTNTMAIERILTGFFEANRSKEQES